MAWSLTQKNLNESGDGSSITSIGAALTSVAAGALVVVFVKHEGAATTITVSDGTTSATAGTKTSHANNDLHGQFFYYLSHAGGTKTFTASFAAGRPYSRIHVWEIALGGDTASLSAQSGGSSAGSTSVSSGTITTSVAAGVALGGYGEYSNAVPSAWAIAGTSSGTNHQGNSGSGTALAQTWANALSSTISGSATLTLASSQAWICRGITFQGVAAGGNWGGLTSDRFNRLVRTVS